MVNRLLEVPCTVPAIKPFKIDSFAPCPLLIKMTGRKSSKQCNRDPSDSTWYMVHGTHLNKPGWMHPSFTSWFLHVLPAKNQRVTGDVSFRNLQGRARTQSPTTTNYAVEIPMTNLANSLPGCYMWFPPKNRGTFSIQIQDGLLPYRCTEPTMYLK